jgi:hypothetical protein
MSGQLTLDGRDTRVKTYLGRCLCHPCWCGKCAACGTALTKHAFTEDEAYAEAIDALDNPQYRWRHVCGVQNDE